MESSVPKAAPPCPITIRILQDALREGASDLHLNPSYPPMVRVHGLMAVLRGYSTITPQDPITMLQEICAPDQLKRLEKDQSLDFTWGFEQNRFRTNVALTRTGYQICFRVIPVHIPSPEELGLPQCIIDLADLKHGLVLVTGRAGAGKSTTLASLLNLINQRRAANIVTIEDPIEFVYPQKRSLISQREVGPHAPSFEGALRDVLRQDPDVVMIGEMRDLETISAAITVAETGHVVYATLHSYDAPSSIDRMIDVFPSRQQQQIRIQLAGALRAVVSQNLIPTRNGGRVAAREILLLNNAIGNLIRQSRTHEIPSAIEMGSAQGMISMERSLMELVRSGAIDPIQLTKARSGT